jgi:mannose-1-phosphate guanylyltransferase
MPKCLVQIDGRPLLDYWIELLTRGGIVDILINLHHLPEAVRSYLSSCRSAANITTVYEHRLLGTGGTLLKNRSFFGGGPAMLVHADNLSLFDVRAFVKSYEHREKGVEITMMTFHADRPQDCGIVELDDRGVVRAFHEKVAHPPGNLANAAVYIVSPSVMDFLADLDKDVIDFSTEVLPRYMGRINTFHNDVYHRDIGTPESLSAAQEEYPAAFARYADAASRGRV